MDWQDEAIVLSVRHHGEDARIAMLLTESHGRHAGLLRGSGHGKKGGALQPGQVVRAAWRARLAEHLGHLQLEPLSHPAALMLDDAARLAALTSVCALIDAMLPEREPHPNLFAATKLLFERMPEMDEPGHWGALYVRWEVGLLAEMGYGLDLERCAVSGQESELSHVSPRTGRAVSAEAAAPYEGRLLRLPAFLVPGRAAGGAHDPAAEVLAGLTLTGHFLEHRLFAALHGPVPAARPRLIEAFGRAAAISGGPGEEDAISPP